MVHTQTIAPRCETCQREFFGKDANCLQCQYCMDDPAGTADRLKGIFHGLEAQERIEAARQDVEDAIGKVKEAEEKLRDLERRCHVQEIESKGGPPAYKRITICLRDCRYAPQDEVKLKDKTSDKMGMVMQEWCDRHGEKIDNLRCVVDGRRVIPNHTPQSLCMKDGDVMEVHVKQPGRKYY